jgi:hypothetical protein
VLTTRAAFNEQGFDSVMEYLYTGAVQGITTGRSDIDKLQAAQLHQQLSSFMMSMH